VPRGARPARHPSRRAPQISKTPWRRKRGRPTQLRVFGVAARRGSFPDGSEAGVSASCSAPADGDEGDADSAAGFACAVLPARTSGRQSAVAAGPAEGSHESMASFPIQQWAGALATGAIRTSTQSARRMEADDASMQPDYAAALPRATHGGAGSGTPSGGRVPSWRVASAPRAAIRANRDPAPTRLRRDAG
jgi:hypothetical protein